MKQAWGWLMAGVVAAGLNASYHDGGLRMVHEMVGRASHNVEAVLALASGDADRFLTQARIVTAQRENSSCPFTTSFARVQTQVARSDAEWARVEVMSDRQQAALDRMEANRARIEAQVVRVAEIRIPAAAFQPMVFVTTPKCPRVRMNVPQITVPRISAPNISLPKIPDVRVAVSSDPI
ncbi:MAG TPA: hypothetical protein VMH04_10715 [Candidatus Solibacter sp.]|nr:hypothetical protein [Candidatus Solibacter sp.]